MPERRQITRWQVNREAPLKFEGAVAPTSCTIYDISLKGAKISLSQKLSKDTSHKVSITLCDELACLDIEMWIAWHRRIMETNVYGVYFIKIKDCDKENIYKFMRRYFSEELNKKLWQGIKKEGGETMQDRRIFERFSAQFPLRVLDLNSGKEGQANTFDISAKGIGFMGKEELPKHTPVEMWLEIPDKGEPLYTRGEVVWSFLLEPNKCRIGVNLEKADLMGLSRVLRTM